MTGSKRHFNPGPQMRRELIAAKRALAKVHAATAKAWTDRHALEAAILHKAIEAIWTPRRHRQTEEIQELRAAIQAHVDRMNKETP